MNLALVLALATLGEHATPPPVVGTCPPLPGYECVTKQDLWIGVLSYRADFQSATASLATCREDLAARSSTVVAAMVPMARTSSVVAPSSDPWPALGLGGLAAILAFILGAVAF